MPRNRLSSRRIRNDTGRPMPHQNENILVVRFWLRIGRTIRRARANQSSGRWGQSRRRLPQ